jgi:hypothetical protein
MRVRFGKSIYVCTKVTHPKESKLLLFTTPNGIYTVDMITNIHADLVYEQMLIKGYFDASQFEYEN